MALQTHTQGCLLSEAFPRCCATKLHTRMGGCSEGGIHGSTEGWRVSLQRLRLTAGINTSLSRGLHLGLQEHEFKTDMENRQSNRKQTDKQVYKWQSNKRMHVSLTSSKTSLSPHINSSILEHLCSFSVTLCLHQQLPNPTSQPLSSYVTGPFA